MKSVATANSLNICVVIIIVGLVSVTNSDPILKECDKHIIVNQYLNIINDFVMCADKSKCIWKINVCDGRLDCPDGSDEVACTKIPCGSTQCASGDCVNKKKVECDGADEDCEDGTDEWHDTCIIKCTEHSFRCNYGAYIYKDYVCDGIKNCADGSDETADRCLYIDCGTDSFKCDYGACIPKAKMCNGAVDCVDGSDESVKLCSTHTCPPNSFKCDYGSCIEERQVCNGQVDCMDRSDESVKTCSNSTCLNTNLLHRYEFRVPLH